MLKSGMIFTFFLVACASATLSPPYVHVRQAHLAATSTPDVTSTVVADLIPEASTIDIVKVKCAECGDDKPDYDYTRAAQKQQHKLRRTHASELPETTKEVEESMFTTPPPNATPAPKAVESRPPPSCSSASRTRLSTRQRRPSWRRRSRSAWRS